MKHDLHFLIRFVAILALLSPAAVFGQQQFKIAAVDMAKLFADYYKTKKAEAELKDRAQGYEKELKDRATELQKIEDNGRQLKEDAENPAYTDEKKAEKRKLFEAKKNEFTQLATTYQELKQTRERELLQQKNRMRTTIVEEITQIIQQKAKKEGYSLVIDKSGLTVNMVPPFLYVQDSLDITTDIMKTLNAGAPPGTATTSPATTPSKDAKDKDAKKP
ncbi:MAG: OmpH family outer membrane protein [Verrucomicrobia bacterium]|nr:OmpH family outer membrane protein [Verrucomicrobiota bacterium]